MNAVGPMVWKNRIARNKYLQILSRVFKGRREGTQITDKKQNKQTKWSGDRWGEI